MQAEQLISELIATGIMNDDTLAELERMRAEDAAGTLHPDDLAYLQALHARVTNGPMPEPTEAAVDERLDGLTLAEWRERALKAEAELAEIRDLQAGGGG